VCGGLWPLEEFCLRLRTARYVQAQKCNFSQAAADRPPRIARLKIARSPSDFSAGCTIGAFLSALKPGCDKMAICRQISPHKFADS
jgi:hypothetical protein